MSELPDEQAQDAATEAAQNVVDEERHRLVDEIDEVRQDETRGVHPGTCTCAAAGGGTSLSRRTRAGDCMSPGPGQPRRSVTGPPAGSAPRSTRSGTRKMRPGAAGQGTRTRPTSALP